MGKDERAKKLYIAIKNSKNNVHFGDLCKLAEMVGCAHRGIKGDHHIYYHGLYEGPGHLLNFQSINGKAKPYQVRQLLDLISENNLVEE
jgi:hypothetical protein